MRSKIRSARGWTLTAKFVLLSGCCATLVHAAEHVTLKNGFDLVCDHRDQMGDKVRLYFEPGSSSFVELEAEEVAAVDLVPSVPAEKSSIGKGSVVASSPDLGPAELHEMLTKAGVKHNIDVNLLESVVRAESGGHARAISKTGAEGLMQLMPKTAVELGVSDSFRAEENVGGGSAYLDALLTRYHDNLALALAAYNAGPAAVDRYHGVPPYHETRAYVARIIRQFNAASLAARRQQAPKRLVSTARVSTASAALKIGADQAAIPAAELP